MFSKIAVACTLLVASTVATPIQHRVLQGADGGRGGRGGPQTCDFQTIDEAVASLDACGASTVAELPADCSNRCARELLPLARACTESLGADVMAPLQAFETACAAAMAPNQNSRPGGHNAWGLGGMLPGGTGIGGFNPTPPSDTASCSSADVLPVVLACSSFLSADGTAVAINADLLSGAAGFCQSKCH
eukprot:SAG11_NODE_9500_length_906_cov_1.387856_1_plen_189_part_01